MYYFNNWWLGRRRRYPAAVPRSPRQGETTRNNNFSKVLRCYLFMVLKLFRVDQKAAWYEVGQRILHRRMTRAWGNPTRRRENF